MGSRGNGGGWLVAFLWLFVIAMIIEMVKIIIAAVAVVAIAALTLALIVMAVYGFRQLSSDLESDRAILVKSLVPLCIMFAVVALAGPKVLVLFQKETGMLWWHKTETNYLGLSAVTIVVMPVLFGFGYAIASLVKGIPVGPPKEIDVS